MVAEVVLLGATNAKDEYNVISQLPASTLY